MTSVPDSGGVRQLELAGAYNVRDVGGYPTVDGKQTRWRRLMRADSLHRLPEESQRALIAYGLGTVIDLRRPSEAAREPNVFAGSAEVRYHNLPLLPDEDLEAAERAARTPGDLYTIFVDGYQPQIRSIMAALAEAEAPALVHCYVGKDRTGTVVALALGAAGVPHEVIADDYALSEWPLAPLMAEIRARLVQLGLDVERFDRLTPAPREAMLATLAHLDARYGGVTGYLRAIGLTAEQVGGLRRLLVEEPWAS
jgi:protein-tyrosine phosphatase